MPNLAHNSSPKPISTLAAQVAAAAKPQAPQTTLIQSRPQLVPSASASSVASPALATKFQRLQRAADTLRQSAIEIAFIGWEIESADGWQALGFDSAESAGEILGLSAATWRNYLTLGSRLHSRNLTLDQAQKLTMQSASLLMKIHPTLWTEFAWIDEAMMLSAKQFAALIDDRHGQLAAADLPRGAEFTSSLTLSLPASRRAIVETKLTNLRRSLGASSDAATLEQALDIAARQTETRASFEKLSSQLAALDQLWPSDAPWQVGTESSAEREARFAGESWPTDLTEAAARSQSLTRSLRQTLEDIHASLS